MKRPELAGVVIGGVIGIGISLGMDLLLGESVGLGWRNAVAHDLGRLLKTTVLSDSILAWGGAILAIAFLGAAGAAAGYIFVRIVRRFFGMLLSEE